MAHQKKESFLEVSVDAIDTLKQKYIHAKEIVHKSVEGGLNHPYVELSLSSKPLVDIPPGICYLSHPYEVPEDNILWAGEITCLLQEKLKGKCTVLSLVHNWPFGCSDVLEDRLYWLELCHALDIIEGCKSVFMAPGWENSLGCCVEYLHALSLGKSIFIVIEEEKE